MGADETEEVLAVQDDAKDRNISLSDAKPIKLGLNMYFQVEETHIQILNGIGHIFME